MMQNVYNISDETNITMNRTGIVRLSTVNQNKPKPNIEPISELPSQSTETMHNTKQFQNNLQNNLKSSLIQKHANFEDDKNYYVMNELENGAYFGEVSVEI